MRNPTASIWIGAAACLLITAVPQTSLAAALGSDPVSGDHVGVSPLSDIGACCFPNGGCIELDALVCSQSNGLFQGAGTDCEGVDCPIDCNSNGIPDDADIRDCPTNGAGGVDPACDDCNSNGIPDGCEEDCNSNGVPDECDMFDPRNALQFDGVDDYVNVVINVSESAYTASLWFRTTCQNCGIYSVVKNPLGGSSHDRHIYLTGGNIGVRTWNNETIVTSGTDYADGQWHQVVHVFGASIGGQRIYVDGTMKASGIKSFSDFSSQERVNIGFSNDGSLDFFAGAIDEVRVWHVALSPQEIMAGYVSGIVPRSADLTARWSFDEAGGVQTVFDDSGLGNDGSLGETLTPGPDDPTRITAGSRDCNSNGIPDECDIRDCPTNGTGGVDSACADCNSDGIPDGCEEDCNTNGVADECDIRDCPTNGAGGVDPACDDCNANGTLDECDIANGISLDSDSNGIPDECELSLDIKPGSCPNPLNRKSKGVLPVGLPGTAGFDVSQVVISSITISRADGVGGAVGPNEGPPGPHTVIDDVATPFDAATCGCHDATTDGIDDLMMHFRTQDVVDALELDGLSPGDTVELVVRGVMSNGLHFQAFDCIVIVPPGNNNLTVTSNLAGVFVEVSPPDINVDGAGFATFQRSYPIGTLLAMTAPDQSESGRPFRRWSIDGVLQPPGNTTVHLTLMENATVRALYRLRPIKAATLLADGGSDPDSREAGSRSQPASGASAGGAGACGAFSGMGLIALPFCLMGWMVKRGRGGRRP